MPAAVVSSLIVYMLVSSFTPGPGNILALNTVTSNGWKNGKSAIYGIFLGYFCVQAICALIVYGLASFAEPMLKWLRYVGFVYLLWLAYHVAVSKPDTGEDNSSSSFWNGFLLQFVNVKIYLYGITALTGYITPYHSSLPFLLGTEMIIAVVGSLATLTWAGAGVLLQRVYREHYRPINYVLAAFLGYCAITMLLQSA